MTVVSRLFAARDLELFPQDENGDILFGIWKRGGDLDVARAVDFSLIFPTEQQARAFAEELQPRGKVEVSCYEQMKCWDLLFSPVMIPSWKNISETDNALAEAAAKHDGKNDGWGFFAN